MFIDTIWQSTRFLEETNKNKMKNVLLHIYVLGNYVTKFWPNRFTGSISRHSCAPISCREVRGATNFGKFHTL